MATKTTSKKSKQIAAHKALALKKLTELDTRVDKKLGEKN